MSGRKRCHSASDTATLNQSDVDGTFHTVTRKRKKNLKNDLTQSQPCTSFTPPIAVSAPPTDPESCVFCGGNCNGSEAIQCRRCCHFHHLVCCGLEPDIFPVAIRIGNLLGWTCEACRLDLDSTIAALRNELNEAMASIADIKAVLGTSPATHPFASSLSQEGPSTASTNLPSSDALPMRSYAAVARNNGGNATISKGEVVAMVAGTIKELNKRKNNIVISGLREDAGRGDVAVAIDFLASHFPSVSSARVLSASRLGASSSNSRSRKLLVRFSSEHEPNVIINAAKSLRNSADNYIRANVYVNGDLSKDEAKLAYERRVGRRNRAAEGAGSGDTGGGRSVPTDGTTLRPSAAEFIPPPSLPIPLNNSIPSTYPCSSSNPSSSSQSIPVVSSTRYFVNSACHRSVRTWDSPVTPIVQPPGAAECVNLGPSITGGVPNSSENCSTSAGSGI